MIVVDENVNQMLIDKVEKVYEVFSIREHKPGISDKEVIKTAKSKKRSTSNRR